MEVDRKSKTNEYKVLNYNRLLQNQERKISRQIQEMERTEKELRKVSRRVQLRKKDRDVAHPCQ